jgi:transcriptional regulator with XRE-family HTH domain
MSASSNASIDHEAVVKAAASIGRRIAGARAYRSLSQSDVARIAETTPSRVSAIENASIYARIDTILRVAQAVGLEVTLTETAS